MRFFIKKILLIFSLVCILLPSSETFGKDIKFQYSEDNISNYLSGVISLNQGHTTSGFNYLNKVQSLKKIHSNFNVKFIHTLILLEKFDKAFAFSNSIWIEDELFFEVDLLLGLESFIKKDFKKAEKYFKRLNKASDHNLFFEDLFGNILITWVKASENKQKESFNFLKKIPLRFESFKKIQNSFLHCYFDLPETEIVFGQLIASKDASFDRYNFFLTNYLLHKNENNKAKELVNLKKNAENSNLLIKQTRNFILDGKNKKIKKFFNCKNPKDIIAENLYVIANLYSSENNYKLSNFYLKLSLFLNDKFTPYRTLLAENFLNQKKYELSKTAYNSLKSIGEVYSWYAAVNVAIILSEISTLEKSISSIEKDFNSISAPDFQHYYEVANFFKENEYHKKSIKYYTLALQNINQDHFLVPKILYRRGTSYERLGDWADAENDLIESLEILPDQAHVLNYLAYSWIEKKKNIDKSIEMLEKAHKLRENDGYIIDSLGWGHFAKKNYVEAEKFLQIAVQILPLDPIINDHYADALWMLNKNIQARYFWNYVLGLEKTEQKLKDNISKKLIFGIKNQI